jgi:GNAT superfamily N-acetyltransferase
MLADDEFPGLPPTPLLELKSLYVAADQRGSGLGTRLLTSAVGARPAFLWVFEANRRARNFYLRNGFRGDGAAKIDPDTGVPEIRMTRDRRGA